MMRGLGRGVKEFKKGMKEGEEILNADEDTTEPPAENSQYCAPEEKQKHRDAEQ